jgi:hypothetical protein
VGYKFYAGRGLLVFQDLAEVAMDADFAVAGKVFKGTLPKGTGYNPKTNQTRAFIDFRADAAGLLRSKLAMKQTQRHPGAPVGSGVTGIHVMMPRSPGGTARIGVDDTQGLQEGPAGEPLATELFLTRGLHAVKVCCNAGAFDIRDITVR